MPRNLVFRAFCVLAIWCLLVPVLSFAQASCKGPVPAAPDVKSVPAEIPALAAPLQTSASLAAPGTLELFQRPVRPVTTCGQYICGQNISTSCPQVCGDAAFCNIQPGHTTGHCELE